MLLSLTAAAARPAPKVNEARALASAPASVVVADGKAWIARAGKSPPNLSARLSVASSTSAPRLARAEASAAAGKRCPPVPPAASRIERAELIPPSPLGGRDQRPVVCASSQ